MIITCLYCSKVIKNHDVYLDATNHDPDKLRIFRFNSLWKFPQSSTTKRATDAACIFVYTTTARKFVRLTDSTLRDCML